VPSDPIKVQGREKVNDQIPDDGPNLDDEFMRDAFDPNYRFPPIERPPESVRTVMGRVSESMGLLGRCPGCDARVAIEEVRDGMPLAVGVTHQPDCPDAPQE
jgi:hypothetical protein